MPTLNPRLEFRTVGGLAPRFDRRPRVGTDDRGIFRSTDGGQLGLPLATFNGQWLADPVRPGLLYAGTSGSSVLRLENR